MYLKSLHLSGFRSCLATKVEFDATLTLLAGENNAGKTSIIDAIRICTEPTHGRRDLFASEKDITRGSRRESFEITCEFSGLSDEQKGALLASVVDISKDRAIYTARYDAPEMGKQRGRLRVWPGLEECKDPEPETRKDLIRHVHLPALRDAKSALASSNPTRIRYLLQRLSSKAEVEDFVSKARTSFTDLQAHDVVKGACNSVGKGLEQLTEGVHAHGASLQFADPTLLGLSRSLQFMLIDAGFDPTPMSLDESGLGYANLLYMATIVVELEAAEEADLTLFLVEEPEAHLHPQLQATTLEFLHRRAKESAERDVPVGQPQGRIQVVATTHSPHLTSAVSIEKVVVCRRSLPSEAADGFDQGEVGVGGAPDEALPTTNALSIAELGLDEKSVVKKLDRYLNVTRSSLLFARRIMLVEGLADALVIPELVKEVISNHHSVDSKEYRLAWARFVATALIPIDGVDFEPYLRLLLTPVTDRRIADLLVVVTDGDPDTPSKNRAKNLQDLATQLNSDKRFKVCVAPNTLEAELVRAGNIQTLKQAFLELHPKSEKKWTSEIEDKPEGDRAMAVVQLLQNNQVRKGDYAQRAIGIGNLLAPDYLKDAIEFILDLPYDVADS